MHDSHTRSPTSFDWLVLQVGARLPYPSSSLVPRPRVFPTMRFSVRAFVSPRWLFSSSPRAMGIAVLSPVGGGGSRCGVHVDPGGGATLRLPP